jgi:hypothetical protein
MLERTDGAGGSACAPSDAGSDQEAPAAVPRQRVFMPKRSLLMLMKAGSLWNKSVEDDNVFIVRCAGGSEVKVRAAENLVAYNVGEAKELFAYCGADGVYVAFKPYGWNTCARDIPGFNELPDNLKLYFAKLEFDQLQKLSTDAIVTTMMMTAAALATEDSLVRESYMRWSMTDFEHSLTRAFALFYVIAHRSVITLEVFGEVGTIEEAARTAVMLRHKCLDNYAANAAANAAASAAANAPPLPEAHGAADFQNSMPLTEISRLDGANYKALFGDDGVLPERLSDSQHKLYQSFASSSTVVGMDHVQDVADEIAQIMGVEPPTAIVQKLLALKTSGEAFGQELLKFVGHLPERMSPDILRAVGRALKIIECKTGCGYYKDFDTVIEGIFDTCGRILEDGAVDYVDYAKLFKILVKAIQKRAQQCRADASAAPPLTGLAPLSADLARAVVDQGYAANFERRTTARNAGDGPVQASTAASRKRLLDSCVLGPPAPRSSAPTSRAIVPYASSSTYGPVSASTSAARVRACFEFQKGQCTRGASCRFAHVLTPCFDFQMGQCKRGAACNFSH